MAKEGIQLAINVPLLQKKKGDYSYKHQAEPFTKIQCDKDT